MSLIKCWKQKKGNERKICGGSVVKASTLKVLEESSIKVFHKYDRGSLKFINGEAF